MFEIARKGIYAVLCLSFILQGSLWPALAPQVPEPDIFLLVLIFFSLNFGHRCGTELGIVAGYLIDSFFGTLPVFYIFLLPIVGFLIGVISDKLFKDNFITIFLAIIFSKIFLTGTWFAVYHLSGGIEKAEMLFSAILLPQLIVTLLFSIPFFKLLRFLFRRPAYLS